MPEHLRAKTRTLAAYDDEWARVLDLAKEFKTPFDFIRHLIREKHPTSRSVMREPKMLKADR